MLKCSFASAVSSLPSQSSPAEMCAYSSPCLYQKLEVGITSRCLSQLEFLMLRSGVNVIGVLVHVRSSSLAKCIINYFCLQFNLMSLEMQNNRNCRKFQVRKGHEDFQRKRILLKEAVRSSYSNCYILIFQIGRIASITLKLLLMHFMH